MFKLNKMCRTILCVALLTTAVWTQQPDADTKFYELTRSTTAAYLKGDGDRAKSLAFELVKEAESWKKDWNYGNALHVGNLVLGLVALDSADLVEAKKRLVAAGRTPGSPQLDTFGPNMLLAERLLAKGETATVLEYFDLCSKFWKSGLNDELPTWVTAVKAGKAPDFGANLKYGF